MRKTVSGVMLTLLLVGVLAWAFNIQPVKASGTIYIRADGSIDPSTANITSVDNVTYTFTDSIYISIVVERGNIVIDGNDYTLQGSGNGNGFYWTSTNNVTIKNTNIERFGNGIYLNESSGNVIGNNITNNGCGVYLDESSCNTISGNNITNNNWSGICVYSHWVPSFSCSPSYHSQYSPSSSYSNVISGNSITNNDGSGVYLCNSGSTVSGNNIANNGDGIYLTLYSSCSVIGNDITNNGESGVCITEWSHCTVIGNNITGNSHGVQITDSYYSTVSGNSITNNADGIYTEHSSDITISGNNITSNGRGVQFSDCSENNFVVGNNIASSSQCGIRLYSSGHTSIYHNNLGNTNQVLIEYSDANVWDHGYPYGGNHWAGTGGYPGVDLYRGPYQNETGNDGIGDTPYVIDTNNQDNYPFLQPNGWLENFTRPSFSLKPNPAYVGQTVTMLGNLTNRLGQPISNTKIHVYVNGTLSGTLVTNSSGWFTAAAKVNVGGTYNVTVVCTAQKYSPSIHTESLVVHERLDTEVLFTFSPNPAGVGKWVLMAGNLTDSHSDLIGNAPLEVYVKSGTGPWEYVGNISTDSSGKLWVFGRVTTKGTYQVAVLYRGSYKHNLSYHIETLTVNP